jgi:hypothetical protein
MRLPPPLIDLVSRRLVLGLIQQGVLSSDHPERTVESVAHLIAGDLKIEDDVTEEARQLLLEHQGELKGKDLEYHSLIAKAKGQIAARRGYVLSTGPGKLSREKIQNLTTQVVALFLKDQDIEYFVKDQDLRNAVLRALEHEMAHDAAREERAREKVRRIRRNIPEESGEFHALFQQFYRELLDKGQ